METENQEPHPPADAPTDIEKQLAEKDEIIAAREREYAAMKSEYEAKLAEKDAAAENASKEFAAKLAEKDAALSKLREEMTRRCADFDAWRAEEEKKAAAARAVAEAEFATKLAQKDARIAELEAAAKTAEQLAAEKYGAGVPAKKIAASGGIDAADLKERWDAVKNDPVGRVKFIRGLDEARFRALFPASGD